MGAQDNLARKVAGVGGSVCAHRGELFLPRLSLEESDRLLVDSPADCGSRKGASRNRPVRVLPDECDSGPAVLAGRDRRVQSNLLQSLRSLEASKLPNPWPEFRFRYGSLEPPVFEMRMSVDEGRRDNEKLGYTRMGADFLDSFTIVNNFEPELQLSLDNDPVGAD
jgi:hypothetical protein